MVFTTHLLLRSVILEVSRRQQYAECLKQVRFTSNEGTNVFSVGLFRILFRVHKDAIHSASLEEGVRRIDVEKFN